MLEDITEGRMKTNKTKSLLKYYLSSGSIIQLKVVSDANQKIIGKVLRVRGFFQQPYIILESPEGYLAKLFIEDIISDSIFPESFIKNVVDERKTIPKSLRKKLWRNHFGDQWKAQCFVCSDIISKEDFHAGHVVSVKQGGTDNISNLRPICKTCNGSMGSTNLNEFKNKYH